MRFFKNCNVISYLSLISLLLNLHLPVSLYADQNCSDCCSKCFIDPSDENYRNRVACIIAGLTAVGLGVGIACAAKGGIWNHSSSCSSDSSNCSYSRYHNYSYYSPFSRRSHCKDSSYSRAYSRSHSHYSSFVRGSGYKSFLYSTRFTDDNPVAEGVVGLGGVNEAMLVAPIRAKVLTGSFMTASNSSNKGIFSAFVQLPDGSTHRLGKLNCSSHGNVLNFGPFEQEGNYTFGIQVEEGNEIKQFSTIGSVEIDLDGSAVQKHDFQVPPHPPTDYHPPTCLYLLHP